MSRTEQHDIDLPPAKLSKKQMKEINDAKPLYFEGNMTWAVLAGKTRITEDTLDGLFKSVEGERGITEFSLSVEVKDLVDVTLELNCWDEQSFLSYSCPPDKSGEMQQFERIITGVFRENKRRGSWLPWINSPIIELGDRPTPRLNLSWNRIFENVITNALSYLVILAIGLIIGFLLGRTF